MNKFRKSKSSLVLMELIITIMFFSICAAVCMQLFTKTHLLGKQTEELNNSVAIAQGYAEIMRGTDGTLEKVLEYVPEAVTDNSTYFEVYYDSDFTPCEYEDGKYLCKVVMKPDGVIQNMDITITRMENGENIYSLNATKYMHNK